jgi:hypothetical protein
LWSVFYSGAESASDYQRKAIPHFARGRELPELASEFRLAASLQWIAAWFSVLRQATKKRQGASRHEVTDLRDARHRISARRLQPLP